MSNLIDGFGRVHRDLRISLTDHCNLRCTYCMPSEGVPWLPRNTLLSPVELMRIVEVAVAEGITEVRLTGGEPLLRPDVVDVVAAIHSIENAPEISITTNGIALPRLAQKLADAGLARVNVSIDTLDKLRFKVITRRDRLDDVLEGIDAAKAAGLAPVKINSVLMRGINDDEAPALLRWAIANDLELRFIEQMPLDAGHTWSREGMITAAEILASLRTEYHLEAVPGRGAAPAERFLVDGGPHTVGIIASVTMPFCGACDRLRLTADGQLRSCLFSTTESDLREPLRSGASDEEVAAILHRCLGGKLAGHGINEPGFLQPPRPMSAIGG
ncbi:GTP 3',8-cyclase MoaA [Tessaracoccus antarcticus]|uniref:GTP 3',8-cyclase n=1 Tax=Tessaracoccus antarcticus TaxID=2479848 RepID=A0A3M0GCD0_9ACTN|nr:GTP 3',8-cyclase MoaA [Tessaracoccus antarcticus]RMB62117.1 GTP 3',8-cyclase MoaA [Tessaracoccus antarcticus]